MRTSYLRRMTAMLMLACMSPAIACTETGAFGFRFGQPVPTAAQDITIGMFGGGRIFGHYQGVAPEPFRDFTDYGIASVTDRKAVYGITAIRELAPEWVFQSAQDHPERALVREKGRIQTAELMKFYSDQHGFVFEKDGQAHFLQWKATTPTLELTIGTYGPRYVYIECLHRPLRNSEGMRATKLPNF